MGIVAILSWSPFYDISKDSICQCSIQLVSALLYILTTSPREGLYMMSYYGFRGYTVLMLIAAVYPVRVSYAYRFVTLSIFQFFYWTISPVMSDYLLQISYGFYYVRVVCPWFIAPYLLQSLQFVIVTFSVYQLSNYFSISYAVPHDFSKVTVRDLIDLTVYTWYGGHLSLYAVCAAWYRDRYDQIVCGAPVPEIYLSGKE